LCLGILLGLQDDTLKFLDVAFVQGMDVEVVNIVPGFAAFESNQFDIGDLVLTIDNTPVHLARLSPLAAISVRFRLMRKAYVMLDYCRQFADNTHRLQVRGMDLANIKRLTIGNAGTNVVLTMRSLIEVCAPALPSLAAPGLQSND
jgi:hypothetical protein